MHPGDTTLHNDMLVIKAKLQLKTCSIAINYILDTHRVIGTEVYLSLCHILFVRIPYGNLDEAFE